MADSMKGIGIMTLEMVKDLKDIQMETRILDISKWVKHMAKVCIHGVMVKFMMVNGTKV